MSTTKTKERKVEIDKIYFGDYRIIASGLIIVTDRKDLLFEFKAEPFPVLVRVRFVDDNKKQRITVIDSSGDEFDSRIINIHNYNSISGSGNAEPINIFSSDEDDYGFYLNVWVTKFTQQLLRFEYTFFLFGKSKT